jgi:hypothetical protein
VRTIFNTSVWLQAGQHLAIAAQIPAKQKSGCRPLMAYGRTNWRFLLPFPLMLLLLLLLLLPCGTVCRFALHCASEIVHCLERGISQYYLILPRDIYTREIYTHALLSTSAHSLLICIDFIRTVREPVW